MSGLFILCLIVVMGGIALSIMGTLFELLAMLLGGIIQGIFFLIFAGLKIIIAIGAMCVLCYVSIKIKNNKEMY